LGARGLLARGSSGDHVVERVVSVSLSLL